MAGYSPVPMENVVLLETDSTQSLAHIMGSLSRYQEAYINSVCVHLPSSYNAGDLRDLVDSCHQVGINLFLHQNQPDAATAWVKRYNVDGFHCTGSSLKPPAYWESKLDSFNQLRPVLLIAHNATDELKSAGFAAASDDGFANALDAVMINDAPVSRLDTALLGEKLFFSKSFPAVRCVSAQAGGGPREEAELLAAFALPGAPCLTEDQLETHAAFLKTFLTLYTNSPVLQYGDCSFYDAGTEDVFTVIREFQGKKLLFAINMRNHSASYKWPDNLAGIKTELILGENITRNGGQELSPYGYQILSFENIVGIEALELDNK